MKLLVSIIASFSLIFTSFASETCSRVATINYQEILVDPNTSQKGEGLRYYIEKDQIAKEFLDEYQRNTQITWKNALLGSLGTGFMISSLFVDDNQNKKIYLISGATMVLLNFLVARTLEITNEQNLNKAVEEYNKRNLPKIFFNPQTSSDHQSQSINLALGLEKSWNF